jgi:hypothetical protein
MPQNSFCKYIVSKIWKYHIYSLKMLLQKYFQPHCKAGGKIPPSLIINNIEIFKEQAKEAMYFLQKVKKIKTTSN